MEIVEFLPVVNEEGIVTGKTDRKKCHDGSMILHPVIHIHLLKDGKLFLQKRSYNKDIQPGKWDTSVGGHVIYGQSIIKSAIREAREELGIDTGLELIPIAEYIWKSYIEHEYVYIFKSFYKGKIHIDNNEVIEGKFWTKDEIENAFNSDTFTPNFEHEYLKIKDRLFL